MRGRHKKDMPKGLGGSHAAKSAAPKGAMGKKPEYEDGGMVEGRPGAQRLDRIGRRMGGRVSKENC